MTTHGWPIFGSINRGGWIIGLGQNNDGSLQKQENEDREKQQRRTAHLKAKMFQLATIQFLFIIIFVAFVEAPAISSIHIHEVNLRKKNSLGLQKLVIGPIDKVFVVRKQLSFQIMSAKKLCHNEVAVTCGPKA